MPSGRVYTFHLRQDATFHDGRPIKAAGRARLPAARPGAGQHRRAQLAAVSRSSGARAYAAGQAKEVEGIGVRDDSTLVLTLEEPLNVFPKLLAMPVAAIVPTPTPAGLRPAPHRKRALEVRLLVARRRHRAGQERRATGAARPRPTPSESGSFPSR